MKKTVLSLALCLALTAFTGCAQAGESAEDLGDAASSLMEDGGNAASDLGDTVSRLLDEAESELNTPANATVGDVPLSDFDAYSTTALGWGQGKITDEKNRPTACLEYQEKYGALGGVFLGDEEGAVTLTFDEGYENGYTASILDTLKEKQAKGVFFCTLDYIESQLELVRRMIDEGHIVANHSATHASTPILSTAEVAEEISQVHEIMQSEFDYTMTLFRNPEGSFCERDLAVAQALGYKSVFWSFAYVDWLVDEQPDPAQSLEKLAAALHPGAIYLLHPVSSTNASILGDFIDAARAQGYEIKAEL